MADERIPPSRDHYPRWITTMHGQRMIVNDQYHHSAMTGAKYDENAQVVQDPQVTDMAAPIPVADTPFENAPAASGGAPAGEGVPDEDEVKEPKQQPLDAPVEDDDAAIAALFSHTV